MVQIQPPRTDVSTVIQLHYHYFEVAKSHTPQEATNTAYISPLDMYSGIGTFGWGDMAKIHPPHTDLFYVIQLHYHFLMWQKSNTPQEATNTAYIRPLDMYSGIGSFGWGDLAKIHQWYTDLFYVIQLHYHFLMWQKSFAPLEAIKSF